MRNELPTNRFSLHLKLFPLIGLGWTLLMAALLAWAIAAEKAKITAVLESQVRSFFKQIVATRYWNSTHGGVYVAVTDKTQPNPYLRTPKRDVTTTDGRRLTLINPAYMTRQISEIARDRDNLEFHITSQNPIRPENRPSEWETEALQSFEAGSDEYHAWHQPSDTDSLSYRYMAPLWTEKACLKCHGKQGYQLGDLRGGISVTLPLSHIASRQDRHFMWLYFRYVLVWVLGMLGLLAAFCVTRREYREHTRLIENLEQALLANRTLQGFIPICAACKKVRNDAGFWDQIEIYIREHSEAEFSHSICPDCMKKLYPEFPLDEDDPEDSPDDQD